MALPLTVGTVAYTGVFVERQQSMDVVSEGNGALSLDVVDAVNVGTRERLVTVTNRLNQDTTVTVSIISGSGTLYTDSGSGDSVTFSLSQGASNTVDIEAGGTGGEQIDVRIEASGAEITATATRTVETLSSGEAAPGYPSAYNDADGSQGQEEPGEDNSIPPGASATGNVVDFTNMQQASDSGATAAIEGDLNVGVVTNATPDTDEYELQIRYLLEQWSAQPTVNVVDGSGNVLQSETLTSTNGQLDRVTIPLNDAADSYIASNDVLYVTYTSSSDVWGFEVDYQRVQDDPPPPNASFTVSCNGKDCTFDASASTGYSHPITEYQWNFGDGTTKTTSGSVTSHTYASNGTYNVKLTVVTSTEETDTESKLVTIGEPSPTFVPPDVYDDIESWSGDPEAANEDNTIPPPNPQGEKVSNFNNMKEIDGSTATLAGDPLDVGVATRGVSTSGSDYSLLVRYSQENWEGDIEVLIVDASNDVLQSHSLPKTGGSLTNETIALNSAAESYVKNNGDLYVRYHDVGGGYISLEIDAHLLKIEP